MAPTPPRSRRCTRRAVALLLLALAGASCARVPPVQSVARVSSAVGDRDARARVAPALRALGIGSSELARRPPRLAQCIENADLRAHRARPHLLAAWPPDQLQHEWIAASLDQVVAWAIPVAESRAPPEPVTTLRAAVAVWSREAASARAHLRRALRGADPAEIRDVANADRIGPPPATATPAARAAAAQAAATRRRAYCRLAQRISLAELDAALAELWIATRNLEEAARALPTAAWPVAAPNRWRTAEGFTVVVGTPGADRVSSGWHLWLDPGGDDEVDATAPSTFGEVQSAVDLGGHDHYAAPRGGAAGSVAALTVLIDAAGDDAYDGGRWSVGAAAFGGAIMVDRAGDDAYAAQRAGIAAALHGTALLLDGGGTDVYTIGVQGQGFAGPGGFALLWDAGGNDAYAAGGAVPDTNRDPSHALSMAQGCGFGLRPTAEGGTGMLVDLGGDDRYQAEIFAQGLGYWGGAGYLWDRAGDDTYVAVQYAQGTGLHFGLGVLSDGAGADTYVAGGLAQGCGHDLGIGVCTDATGDDRYTAAGLAGGAASAGGLGIFWDGAGADRYDLSPLNNLGCDASPAARPGIALHVDAGGRDRFGVAGTQPETSAPARDGATWFNGRAGVAVNRPAP